MPDYLACKDAELLHFIRAQDSNAMDYLIRRYRPLVEIIASKYSGAPIDRDDLIQEGMLGLLSGVYSYAQDKAASPKTYLQLCIERKMINAIRACQRQKDFPPEVFVPLEEQYVNNSFSTDTPEDFVIAKEQADDLTTLLEQNLSKLELAVLRLHMIGCSYEEISKRLNKPYKAVDNALHRVRVKLHKLVLK